MVLLKHVLLQLSILYDLFGLFTAVIVDYSLIL